MELLGTLVNPRADQSDLFRRQGLWWRTKASRSAWATSTTRSAGRRIAATWPAWRTIGRSAGCTRCAAAELSAWPTGTARFRLGRHRRFIVDPRCRDDQQTFLAGAGNNDFAILAAFENCFKAVEAQVAFLPFLAVASETRGFENGADVFGVSEAFLFGRR